MTDGVERLGSEAPTGRGYRLEPPPTRDEAMLTAGSAVQPGVTYGFFTDTTVCIGCKSCEVACKSWNGLPGGEIQFSATSYDNTRALDANTWRHVAFVEQFGGEKSVGRWLFMSNVYKHCEQAGCMEACPTRAIVRTEFGSVYVQQDVCNGCHYCVPSCPFGVVAVAEGGDNRAHKCTLCYDRLKVGMEPACAKACPTDSITFGPVVQLRERARERLAQVQARGLRQAYLYGVPGTPGATGGVGELHCFFLLTSPPEVYNLPRAPEVPSRRVMPASAAGVAAALTWGVATAFAVLAARGRR